MQRFNVDAKDDCDSIRPAEHNIALVVRGPQRPAWSFGLPHITHFTHTDVHVKLAIVGAGLQGIALAARARHLGFSEQDLVIIDPCPRFADRFTRRTDNIGQYAMRSPITHHVAPAEDASLADYARSAGRCLDASEHRQLDIARTGDYGLVARDVFLSHTAHVVAAHRLAASSMRMRVSTIHSDDAGGWFLADPTRTHRVQAQTVILALGQRVNLPRWAQEQSAVVSALTAPLGAYLGRVRRCVCVVGSGNTAAHVVAHALMRGIPVLWCVRRGIRVRCSDIAQRYVRTEGLAAFVRTSLQERSVLLADQWRGSAMVEHLGLIRTGASRGLLRVREGVEISEVLPTPLGAKVALNDGTCEAADIVVNATGLVPEALPEIVPSPPRQGAFPCLSDASLESVGCPGIYIAGPQAAMSLGPASKNIDGARVAAERIFGDICHNKLTSNVSNRAHPYLSQWDHLMAIGS